MSLRLLSSLQALRSSVVKLSRTGLGLRLRITFHRVQITVKFRISVGRRRPSTFGTEWVGISLRGVVMKIFEESHTTAKFVKVGPDFCPVDVTWSRAK